LDSESIDLKILAFENENPVFLKHIIGAGAKLNLIVIAKKHQLHKELVIGSKDLVRLSKMDENSMEQLSKKVMEKTALKLFDYLKPISLSKGATIKSMDIEKGTVNVGIAVDNLRKRVDGMQQEDIALITTVLYKLFVTGPFKEILKDKGLSFVFSSSLSTNPIVFDLFDRNDVFKVPSNVIKDIIDYHGNNKQRGDKEEVAKKDISRIATYLMVVNLQEKLPLKADDQSISSLDFDYQNYEITVKREVDKDLFEIFQHYKGRPDIQKLFLFSEYMMKSKSEDFFVKDICFFRNIIRNGTDSIIVNADSEYLKFLSKLSERERDSLGVVTAIAAMNCYLKPTQEAVCLDSVFMEGNNAVELFVVSDNLLDDLKRYPATLRRIERENAHEQAFFYRALKKAKANLIMRFAGRRNRTKHFDITVSHQVM